MAESRLFESILESENVPPCPLFDLDNGWYGLDGKFKKFYIDLARKIPPFRVECELSN